MLLKYYIIIIIVVVVVVVDRRAYAVAGDLNFYCCTYIIDPSATIGLWYRCIIHTAAAGTYIELDLIKNNNDNNNINNNSNI